MLLFNHKAGPWDQAGFLQQARAALRDLKGFDDHNNVFFAHYYDGIAKEQGTFQEADFGSEQHMQRTWEKMLTDPCWQRKGSKVKWSRWGSMFDVGEQYMSSWFTSLLVLLTLAWQKKWWKDVSACPVFEHHAEDAVIAGLVSLHAATSGGMVAPRTVKDAEKVQETLRSKHKNACHLCCSIQANPVSKRLFAIIMRLGGVARHLMGAAIKRIEKGPESALQTYLSWALGSQAKRFKEMIATLRDEKILAEAGFEFMMVQDPKSIAADAEITTEDELAQRFVISLEGVAGTSWLVIAGL